MSDRKTPHKIEVGNRLRLLMAELEIPTAQKLAEIVGATRTATDNWLNGVAYPQPDQLRKLGEAYRLPVFDWLFTGNSAGLPMQVGIRLSGRLEGLIPPKVVEEPDPPVVDVVPAVPARPRRTR